jgi:hypothetical protein
MFAIASPEATEVREIRVIGEDGQVLQQDSNELPTVYNDAEFHLPVAPSPEDAIRHSHLSGSGPCPNREIRQKVQVLGDFRVLRTVQYSPDKQLVFFRLLCRTHGGAIQSALIGIEPVEQKNLRWQQAEVVYSEQSVNFDIDYSQVRQGNVWRAATYFPLLSFDAPFPSDGGTLSSIPLSGTLETGDKI